MLKLFIHAGWIFVCATDGTNISSFVLNEIWKKQFQNNGQRIRHKMKNSLSEYWMRIIKWTKRKRDEKSAQEKAAFWNEFVAIHHIRAHMSKYEPEHAFGSKCACGLLIHGNARNSSTRLLMSLIYTWNGALFFPAQFQRYGRFFTLSVSGLFLVFRFFFFHPLHAALVVPLFLR